MSARILVIEDNKANLELMTYLLTGSGYIVSGKEFNVALSRGFRRGKAVRSLPAGRLALYECIISSLTVSPSPAYRVWSHNTECA